MGLLRVGHDWVTSLSLFTFIHWRWKWQPTPVFLPGESQGRGSLVGCYLWGRTESDTTEATSQQQQPHKKSLWIWQGKELRVNLTAIENTLICLTLYRKYDGVRHHISYIYSIEYAILRPLIWQVDSLPLSLQWAYNDAQGTLEVKSSAILDPVSSNQSLSCPMAVSFF